MNVTACLRGDECHREQGRRLSVHTIDTRAYGGERGLGVIDLKVDTGKLSQLCC